MPARLLGAYAMPQELFEARTDREKYRSLGLWVEDEGTSAGRICKKDDVVKFFKRHPAHNPNEYQGWDKPKAYTQAFEDNLGTRTGDRIIVVPVAFEESDTESLKESSFRAYAAWYDPTRVNPHDFEAPQPRRTRKPDLERRIAK